MVKCSRRISTKKQTIAFTALFEGKTPCLKFTEKVYRKRTIAILALVKLIRRVDLFYDSCVLLLERKCYFGTKCMVSFLNPTTHTYTHI